MQNDDDNAQVRFPPPLVYVGMLLTGFVIGHLLGDPTTGLGVVTASVLGALLAVIGLVVMFSGVLLFRRVGNNLEPWRPATMVVTTGIYTFTRNPMYLGMALIFAGLALVYDSLAALMLLPVVIIIIQTQVIAREEKYLETKFGDEYRAYKNKVRRWI